MWVESSCLVHQFVTENDHGPDHHPVYKVNGFGPKNESLVADIVELSMAFWPRQTASHA